VDLAGLQKMVAEFESNLPKIKYPYGAFVHPSTYAQLRREIPMLPRQSPLDFSKSVFFGLRISPLPSIPEGLLWPADEHGLPMMIRAQEAQRMMGE
jgi:hypothetical protein